MTDRRNPADGETGLRPHEIRVRLAQIDSGKPTDLVQIDTPIAGAHDQHCPAPFAIAENQRVGNLPDRAAERIGRQLRGSHRLWQNPDLELESEVIEVLLNPVIS